MSKETFIIQFDNAEGPDAGLYAEELRNAILDASPDVDVEKQRADENKQDFGTVLVAVLGTGAVAKLAKALGDWLKLRNSASLTITTKEDKVIAKNLTSTDAAKLMEIFLKNQAPTHPAASEKPAT